MSGNFGTAFIFLVNTLFSLYIMTIILRLLLQLRRADFYNPLSQFVVLATNPLLKPLRRIIPGYYGIDFAALLLAYLFSLLAIVAVVWLAGAELNPPVLLWWGLLKLLVITIQLYFFTILVQVILSWVNPGSYNPVTAVLYSLNEPVLKPFRRFIPPLGGFDLSPVFAIILLQFVNYLIPLPGLLR